ncbi:LPS O-antigen length regulator Wzz(fepE) [Salmonella enterica]
MSSLNIQQKSDPSFFESQQLQLRNNDIDLLSLVGVLWQGKRLIATVMLVFVVVGFFISALLPQKWTSDAEITPAEKIQWAQLQQTITALQVFDVNAPVARGDVFNLFLKKFNSQTLREEFLASSPLVIGQLQSINSDPDEVRRGIALLTGKMKAVNNATEKKGENAPYSSWTLSFSAPTAQEAQDVLNSYIGYISALVVKETLDSIRNEVELKKNFEKDSLAMERVRMDTRHDANIKRLNYSLEVANAAGIKRPVYSNGQAVQDDPDYSIALGADGIAEKLKIEKAMTDVTQLNSDFRNREYRLAALEKVDIKDVNFTPFKYQLSPSLPMKKDGPGKALILMLAVMIGGVVSCVVVLVRHALQQRELL